MSNVTKSAPLVTLIAFLLLVPASAHAQEEPRLRVSFAPAVATVSGDAELALGGTVGYRFSEHVWFEGDFTWIDAAAGGFRDHVLDFDRSQTNSSVRALLTRQAVRFGSGRFPGNNFPFLPDLPGLGQMRATIDGRTLIGTLGIRYELPVQTARFRPYLSGGLGINDTEQDFTLQQTSQRSESSQSVSHTGYAFNGGAGASVRLFKQLWGDVDAKYFRLSQERNIMRLGGGVSVRF
jgi:opacity protein-like surface antigen